MDIVSIIITPVVEALLVPVKRHLGFLFSSTDNVKDMREKVKELEGAEVDMHTQQESRKGDRRVVPHRVPEWLEEVQKIKEMAEELPTRRVGCFSLKTRYKVGRKSSDILKDIDRLMNEKVNMVWTDDIVPLGAVSPSRPISISPVVHEDDENKSMIKSRYLILKKALESLESNSCLTTQKIALCGMARVGKTTMMNEIEKVARDRKMFALIAKAAVGQNPNLEVVQQAIAEHTGKTLTETTKAARAKHLEERFKVKSEEGKKILVVLDDVWDFFNLQDIGLTSPLPNGVKLLLTTREESTCTNMDIEASSIFKINVLEDPEDKTLFWDTVGTVSDTETDLRSIGEDILKRCGGLPIAIKTIASTLKNINERHEWEDALSCIQNQDFSPFRIKEQDNLALINIFEYSYQNLKEDDLKATFLLCGLFPEDCDIDIEDLVICGWGLKFFKSIHDIATARNRVHTYVNKLIRSNLLIKSDRERCVKMHDLVRDFVLSSFSKVKQASIASHNNNNVYEKLEEGECYERILLNCSGMSEFPTDFNHPNLELLMLANGNWTLKLPTDFCSSMKKLMVVTYTNMYQPLCPQFSTNLRALSLFSCKLVDDISFLGGLFNLEVLRLVNCGINKLPSDIGNLKRLKLLDLTGCVNLCVDDGVFQKLEKLQELYMRAFEGSSLMFTDANCDELKVLSMKLSALELEFLCNKARPNYVSFENLKRFKISMGCISERDSFTLFKHDEYSILKNTLKLVISCSELVECNINKLFSKTEVLYLAVNDMSYLEDVLIHPPRSSFSNLTELYISNCECLTYLFTIPVAKGLTKLERLYIISCPVMKSVVHGEDNEPAVITFDNLKVMYLDNLPRLVSLCDPINTVMELRELMELTLNELPSIKSIFNKEIVTPKLEIVNILYMENLKEIWQCESTSSDEEVKNIISMLKKIQVICCDSLVNLFPSNPMRLLSHLEDLRVERCGSIEVLFNLDVGKIEQLSNTVILRNIRVRSCDNLSEVWRIKDDENDHSSFPIRSFQAVEYIDILSCKRFKNIVTPATTYFDFRALRGMSINGRKEYDARDREIMRKTGLKKEITFGATQDMDMVFEMANLSNREQSYVTTQGMEVVFEIANLSNREQSDVTTQQQPLVLLPSLEKLELEKMKDLIHVLKCNNWKEFFILQKDQPQSSFQNLTTIYLSRCKSIKYLFPSLMVKLLSNLKEVKIQDCKGMEEVILNIDDQDEDMMTSTMLLPHFQSLSLICLDNLKQIGGGVANGITHGQSKFPDQFDVVLCQYANKIRIKECHALSSVIPCSGAGRMQKLEKLSIKSCKSLMEVFETKVVAIPRPTISTSTHKLPNLKILKIHKCDCLENIFTFSTLGSLKKLEMLEIRYCTALKVIVKEEAREETMESSPHVVFPQLKSVKLYSLPNLVGFFLGVNTDFQWPLLECVMIMDCPQMRVFAASWSTTPRLKYIHTKLGKHNLECGLNFYVTPTLNQTPISHSISLHPIVSKETTWSYYNLIECNYYDDQRTKIFPSNELHQLQNFETIQFHLERGSYSYVEEVFEVALEGVTDNQSPSVVNIPKLREVYLSHLYYLKNIWKNNHMRMLEFPNLTTLSINGCQGLEHVFTCSMVSCVMKLQELHIHECVNMKAIVKEEEEDCDAKVNEIKFPCLKSLKLEKLGQLKGFCLGKEDFNFPCLKSLVIKGCYNMKIFTMGGSVTPQLTTLETWSGSFNVGKDINSFLMGKQEGLVF